MDGDSGDWGLPGFEKGSPDLVPLTFSAVETPDPADQGAVHRR